MHPVHSTRIGCILRAWRHAGAALAVACLALGPVARADPALTLTPASISWNTNTFVNFDLSGIATGSAVALTIWADIDRDGAAGTNDVLLMQFDLKDGVSNSLGAAIVVCDADSATNGHIQGRVSYHGHTDEAQLWHANGSYVWQAAYTNGTAITSAVLTITEPTGSVWITGSVQALTNASPMLGQPLAGAAIFLNVASFIGPFPPSAWTDTNGNFSICLPPNLSTDNVVSVMALKPGYFTGETGPDAVTPMSIHPLSQPLHAGTNELAGPLFLVPPIPGVIATLSGTVVDSASNALSGVLISASPNGSGGSVSLAVSGTNGAFAIPWPQNGDSIYLNDMTAALNMRGLAGSGVSIASVASDISGLCLTSPVATTLVQGKVKSEMNTGMAGIKVSVYCDTVGAQTFTFTSNGVFEACLVGGSNYTAELRTEALQAKMRVCPTSQIVGLTFPGFGIFTNLGFRTLPGYIVSGHVYDLNTNAVTGGWVWAQPPGGGDNADETSPTLTGLYRLLVPSGTYSVGTYGFSMQGYSDQMWPGNITVTSGNIGGIDFWLAKYTSISGKVLGGGVPLGGVPVQVGTITFNPGGGWNWQQLYNGQTDSNGDYTVTVPPGTNYYAQVSPPQGSLWLGQFYSNATFVSSATVLTSQIGAPATNVSFNLLQGAQISGRVLGEGNPLANASVQAGLIVSNQWLFVAGSPTDGNGDYTLTLYPGSNYVVRADGPDTSAWLGQYYSNTLDRSQASSVNAQPNAPATNISFNLQRSAHISGHVSGGGNPVAGAFVEAGIVTFQAGGWWSWQYVNGANTDSNGDYTLTVLPGTNYTLRAHGPNGSAWLGQYYSNAGDAAHATPVATTNGVPATGINFNLQPGALIMGRVLGGGNPLANAYVEAGTLTLQPGGWWSWQQVGGGSTDTNGDYALAVPAGTSCAVRVIAPVGTAWLQQYFSNVTDMAYATLVAAQIGTPASNVNFNLPQGAQITGRVLGDGLPLAGAYAKAGLVVTGAWQQIAFAATDAGGNYAINLPPGSNYIVKSSGPAASAFLEDYYSNAVSLAQAALVTTTAGTPATNINFALVTAVTISGTVRGNGQPMSNVGVIVGHGSLDNTGQWNWADTFTPRADSNGCFHIDVRPGSNYYAKVTADQGSGWISQYYPLAPSAGGAAPIVPPAANVDFNLANATNAEYNLNLFSFTEVRHVGPGMTLLILTGCLTTVDYTIERSTNVVDWIALITTNCPDGYLSYLDCAPTNAPHYFYRGLTSAHIERSDNPITFAQPSYAVDAVSGGVLISVSRVGGLGRSGSVVYTTLDGSALAGVDYTRTSGTLNFGPGEASKSFWIPIDSTLTNGDDVTVIIRIATPDGGNERYTMLVIRRVNTRPAPLLHLSPAKIDLVVPFNFLQQITISNAGPAESVLNYFLTDNGPLGGFLAFSLTPTNQLSEARYVRGSIQGGHKADIWVLVHPRFTETLHAQAEAFHFSPPLLEVNAYVYTRNPEVPEDAVHVHISSYEQLANKCVGAWSGTWSGSSVGQVTTVDGVVTQTVAVSGTWYLNVDRFLPDGRISGSLIWEGEDAYWQSDVDTNGVLQAFWPTPISVYVSKDLGDATGGYLGNYGAPNWSGTDAPTIVISPPSSALVNDDHGYMMMFNGFALQPTGALAGPRVWATPPMLAPPPDAAFTVSGGTFSGGR